MLVSERIRRQEGCLGRNLDEVRELQRGGREERFLRKRAEGLPPMTEPKKRQTSCDSEVPAKKTWESFPGPEKGLWADKPKSLDAISQHAGKLH